MHYKCTNNYLKFILQVYSSEGRISFTSHTPGEHIICLYSNSSNWFGGAQLVSEEPTVDTFSVREKNGNHILLFLTPVISADTILKCRKAQAALQQRDL